MMNRLFHLAKMTSAAVWPAVLLCSAFAAFASAQIYTVEVSGEGKNPLGGGAYSVGATVKIAAGTPPEGMKFKIWTSQSDGVVFDWMYGDTTAFIMPARNVKVTAEFDKAFIDTRDGKKYRMTKIGDTWWMGENLNYNTADGSGSWCYGNSADSCAKYGRLYDWNTAMAGAAASTNPGSVKGICPTGWHLPSQSEWGNVGKAIGTGIPPYNALDSAAIILKSKSGWKENDTPNPRQIGGDGYDSFGFSALPAGRRDVEGVFGEIGEKGGWWTTNDDCVIYGCAEVRLMVYNNDMAQSWSINKNEGFSVRCAMTERHIVMWHTNGGTLLPVPTAVTRGGDIENPISPGKIEDFAEYVYEGTFYDSAYTMPANPPIITAGQSLYAKWTTVYTEYRFGGWYLDSLLTIPAEFPMKNVKQDLDLYAKWGGAYTVTFNPNGGMVVPYSDTTNIYGKLASLPRPVREDYVFRGWYTAPDGGTKVGTGTVFNANITIYAQWWAISDSYIIVFDPDGGTVSPTVVYTEEEKKLSWLPTPEREHCVFLGWFTAPTGGLEVTTSTVFGADAVVYARWRGYRIEFGVAWCAEGLKCDPPNFGFGGPMNAGLDGKLASLPTLPNLEGWYTGRRGGTRITTDYVFSSDTTVWLNTKGNGETYTITFNPNGGTVSPTSAQIVRVYDLFGILPKGAMLESLPVPTRAGHKFDGWYIEPTDTAEVTTNTLFDANATIYARWTPVTYTITFDPVGGTVSPPSATTDTTGKLDSLPTPERSGYTFMGWYTAETPDITLNNPIRGGYRFDGWTGSNGEDPQTQVVIPQGSSGAKTYIANWTATAYVIYFDLNYGDNPPTESAKTTAATGKLASLPTPTRDGYVFEGWYTDWADGAGEKVTTNTVFYNDATIYARWSLARLIKSLERKIPVVITLGPNPVKSGNEAAIYLTSGKPVKGKLSVFNAVGGKVGVVKVSPSASLRDHGVKKIGTWRVGDVAEGMYIIKGVLTDGDGERVRVSVLVGVVK